MNDKLSAEILRDLKDLEDHIGWQDDKGILGVQGTKMALPLVRIAIPFLKTLVDIAWSLDAIAKRGR